MKWTWLNTTDEITWLNTKDEMNMIKYKRWNEHD